MGLRPRLAGCDASNWTSHADSGHQCSWDQTEVLDHGGVGETVMRSDDQPRVDPMKRAGRSGVQAADEAQRADRKDHSPANRAHIRDADLILSMLALQFHPPFPDAAVPPV